MGDDLVVESDRLASRRDDRVALEHHPQLARFGGDGRIHGRAEVKQQAGRIGGVEAETGLDADAADEQASRAFMKGNRRTQKSRQQPAQRRQRNQSA
ncbi:MAG: hypothetical protein ABSB87_18750 [Terriglobales bacterium]